MPPIIATRFPFERVFVDIEGRSHELCGTATVIGDTVSWRIDDIDVQGPYGLAPFRVREGSQFRRTVANALHVQRGDVINERMNALVESEGGYGVLYGEHIPASPFRRGVPRTLHADAPVVWLEAA